MVDAPAEVTKLLQSVRKGDQAAQASLIRLIYPELRRMARQRMRRERREHTLEPTAVVHEAYLRLTAQPEQDWESRTHFLAIAGNLMKQVLADHARARGRQKRGGGEVRAELDENLAGPEFRVVDAIAMNECLARLAKIDARQVKVVEMLLFAGLTPEEIAQYLGVSSKTVRRDWLVARAWLYRELRRSNGSCELGDR